MELNEITYEGQPPIDSYGPGFFRIENQLHKGDLMLLPTGSVDWAGYKDIEPLVATAGQVDVLFFGTGHEIVPLPKALKNKLEKAGVPFEVMGTPSACRTYNVLLSEGRRVGIAAIAV